MYRIGFPGWKLAARIGFPMTFLVRVHKDEATGTYWAESADLDGLAVAGDTLDEVTKAIFEVSPVLLEASVNGAAQKARADVRYSAALPCAA